jgi:beta-hydroxylase
MAQAFDAMTLATTIGNALAFLVTPRMLVLDAIVASALAIHFRGRERLKFLRQLTDHSTFMAPYNCLAYLFSAVPNTPFLDVRQFPDLKPLGDNWQTIREEALALYDQDRIRRSEKFDDLAFNSFFKSGWKRFYLKWYGEQHASANALCPKTVALLGNIPTVKAAMFALLPPGARLGRHRDPFAGSLRYHLGLVTPNSDACRIYVDGQMYSWRDGEAVLFDETYIHHAANDSDVNRIILFCDVERPLRTRAARAANRFVARTFVAAAATSNEPGEKVGVLNRIFGVVYRGRDFAKRMKDLNRFAYYTVKLSLIGGLVYLVFMA